MDSASTPPFPTIPAELLPKQRQFGSGPGAIFPAHIAALGQSALLGTSHRQSPVKSLVGDVRERLANIFTLPDGYEVVLGNGGASAFWAVATTSLISSHCIHAAFGEFGAKFADETARAPHLQDSVVFTAPPGQLSQVQPHPQADTYAWPHHETSTGVVSSVYRLPDGGPQALTLIDATSIAGGIEVDPSQCDAYYFAPQKCLASEGGLWFALLSPAAIERAYQLAQDLPRNRWMPDILNLSLAIDNSRQNQTLNTPAIATLELLDSQLAWMQDLGGLSACAQRCRDSSAVLYQWAQDHSLATPFVTEASLRSPVVVTIDFEGADAAYLARALRANGIVDVEPYRKLGRNQLRVATFPVTSAKDTFDLTQCLDYLLDQTGVCQG